MTSNVVVIGNFDGVHVGHQAVLRAARRQLCGSGGTVIAVTFWPHPHSVLRPGHGPDLITDLEERKRQLLVAGADEVEVIDFDHEFASWSPARFVEQVIRPLHPAHVVVGANFRFGHKAAGTPATLAELANGDFEVNGLDLVEFDSARTSSTRIRKALGNGDVALAAELLGRSYRFSGLVVHGDERGRELGFPTANQHVPEGLCVPGDGVYAGWVTVREQPELGVLPAAISVGTNPTFDGVSHRIESYILGRTDYALYGCWLNVDFVQRIRGQVRFDGIGALVKQMTDDVAQIAAILEVEQ